MTPTAGIVLAGGSSTRMGSPKAALRWRDSTLLRRAVGLVGRAVDGHVVVVKAPGQELPELPAGVQVTEDARDGRGPLQGLAAGLAALSDTTEVAYVSGVDAPLQHPAFIRHVVRSLNGEHDVALPHAHGFDHPLAAAYRTSVKPALEEVIDGDALGTGALMERLNVLALDEDALLADHAVASLDPELLSLLNLNTPEEYDAARGRMAPTVTVRCWGALRMHGSEPITLCVTSVGAAAGIISIELGSGVVAILNGDRVTDDPQEPLAAGDSVIFTASARPRS
ncbi:MAG: molybdenum cofactor guanylyltransferase [Solirubrobacteraceae bacterium]|jgi:molybdopterin-guanine dinucleotide biosynthesis protein A|nr:molybdenum cofactor guanylyltransferase [Solirubrobacteraceae bacterium]